MIVRSKEGSKAGRILAHDSLLLVTALIWGLAFVAQRKGMESVGPFTYNAVRFALGALCLLPVMAVRRRAAPRQTPAGGIPAGPAGLLAGAVLTVAASLQQVGIVTTTAGKAGFITGLYVILVPLSGLLWGQRAGPGAWGGALLSVIGLSLLSLTDSLSMARGDLIVLVGAFFWTAHVQVVGWLSPRSDPLALACIQFAVCAVLSAVIAVGWEAPRAAGILAAAGPILYGGVLSVGVTYTLQVVAQGSAPPAHAAILMSLESVFAAVGGGLLLGERLGARQTAGCIVMFAGMLAAQAPLFLSSLAARRSRR